MDLRTEAILELGAGVQRPDALPPSEKREEQVAAAREFEAYILKMLLTEMRKTVRSGGLFEDRSMEGYRAMMDDALARRAAEAGTFGLAEQILRQWESQR